MNILLATSAATHTGGGIASYNQELLGLFCKENTIFLLTDANEHDVEGYEKTVSNYGKRLNSYSHACYILERIKDWHIDIVINSNSAIIAVLAPFINVSIITISHFVNGRLALNAGYNAKYLNSIISLSYYGKEYLEKTYNIKEKNKVRVIYNFVSDKKMPAPVSKLSNNPLIIVYPGGTSLQKSADIVMRTLYRLLHTDLNFKFIWLGGTMLTSANLSPHKYLNQFFNKDERLIITGKVSREEAVNYIESANIFLLPSKGEGCPMTLLEAMRAGCIPVVSDAHHGSREILEKGLFGKIAKQGDSKELYRIIEDIIKNHNNYICDYHSTYLYSRNVLSQEQWKLKMINTIKDAINRKRVHITLTERRLRKSLWHYSFLQLKFRCRTVLESLLARLYYEYMFYFVKNSKA